MSLRFHILTRNLTSRDESDIDGCGDGDDDDVEPRTEEEDDAESSDLVKFLCNFIVVRKGPFK